MNPIRRELLNGLFVLVVASLMSAAFAAFQVSFCTYAATIHGRRDTLQR